MRFVFLAGALIAASPAPAQIRAIPEKHILRNAPAGAEEETPSVTGPVNPRPTQLNRCTDLKGHITFQDAPCMPMPGASSAVPGTVPPEVIELSALPPRPHAEVAAPPVEDGSQSRLTQGMLKGGWKLALLLAGCYALFRLARFARDRYRDRFPPPEVKSRIPRRVR